MAPQVNANDPRVKRTRQLLLQAFMALAEETHNIPAISVQAIAERAMVNRATFYAHFEDKYALLESWMREMFQRALQSPLQASSALQANTLRAVILAVLDFLVDFRRHMKPVNKRYEPLFLIALQQEFHAFILNWLNQVPSQAPAHPPILETTAMVISWAIFGTAMQWSRGKPTSSAEEMADHVLTIVVAALSPVIVIA
jgi:AcrR family transcriptional regulator